MIVKASVRQLNGAPFCQHLFSPYTRANTHARTHTRTRSESSTFLSEVLDEEKLNITGEQVHLRAAAE